MASAFPTFPLFGLGVKREEVYKTTVATSPSGKEVRDSWQSTPRRRWTISISALRQYGALTEAASFVTHWESCKGAWDTFNFTDPYNGSTYLVRYESDTMAMERIASGFWAVAQLVLIEVK